MCIRDSYHAKAAGKFRYAVYSDHMKEAIDDKHRLDLELHVALTSRQFFLQYQPTISLATGEITGVEALIRWSHPTRGTIAPNDFIPIAERSGLIIPIGRWVLGEACRQAAHWHRTGHDLGIAINVSARQLDSDELIDDVGDALRESCLLYTSRCV